VVGAALKMQALRRGVAVTKVSTVCTSLIGQINIIDALNTRSMIEAHCLS
jgi:hypothetical protein